MDRQLSTDREAIKPIPKTQPDLDRLPSRRSARDVIRSAMLERRGPVLLTGEPGVGKTVLRRSLEAELTRLNRWLDIEVTPSTDASGFYSLMRQGLGLGIGSFDRVQLFDFLAGRHLEGEHWILVIDEAQNLADELLEETRVLSNRLGEPHGFAAILLIGQSSLAHRLSGRAFMGLTSRIAAHVHLRPLDADEVGLLLQQFDPSRDWSVDLVDQIHLLSQGRPGHVLTMASNVVPRTRELLSSEPTSPSHSSPMVPEFHPSQEPESSLSYTEESLVGPSKPPIRVEEGLIEVGWQAEADFEETTADALHDEDDREFDTSVEGEERINDHYAALQAWQEWATNQDRQTKFLIQKESPAIPDALTPSDTDTLTPLSATPNLWADEEHGFAPLGRLFTRLKQENEVD